MQLNQKMDALMSMSGGMGMSGHMMMQHQMGWANSGPGGFNKQGARLS